MTPPNLTDARWKAVILYRMEDGQFVDVEHYFEEIAELDDLIERGPHWDTLIRCTVTLNRPARDARLTLEKAADSCLAYFRKGKDTMQVAKRFGISEARASRLIWVARSWEKGLPADYDHRGSVRRYAK